MQDIVGFIQKKMRLDSKKRVVDSFLDELYSSNVSIDETLKSAEIHFQSKESVFYLSCISLIEQILYHPSHDKLLLNVSDLHYQDIALLNRIADSFGRFDLGYQLRCYYCLNLEKSAQKSNSKQKDKVLYHLHQQLYGKDLFQSYDKEVTIEVPFYLKRFHNRIMAQCDLKTKQSKIDQDFYIKVHNKTVALLAPGILHFDDQLIQELKEFDEIIPLTYTTKHYKDFPLPINISYYNRFNSQRLLSVRQFNEGIDLEIYCLKDLVTNQPNYREIRRNSYKWTMGSPNMVQVALYDLLCQEPKRIKVFGMDFFLSNQAYHYEYSSNLSVDPLAKHNIVSNFLYVQSLYHSGAVDLDGQAQTLVHKGINSYVTEMTKKF